MSRNRPAVPLAPRSSRGFTLLEILVALAVLGVFSLLAYQGLSRMVDGAGAVKASEARIEEVGRAWDWLDESCARAFLLRLPPLPAEAQHRDEPDPPGFVAEIWRPVADAGSPPQRVLIALSEHKLSAVIAGVGRRAEGKAVLLLDGVDGFAITPLDRNLQPILDWNARTSLDRSVLPGAMMVSLTLSGGRIFHRLFAPR